MNFLPLLLCLPGNLVDLNVNQKVLLNNWQTCKGKNEFTHIPQLITQCCIFISWITSQPIWTFL